MTEIAVRNTRILLGDVRASLRKLAAGSVHSVVTSPPYWGLRAYGTDPQIWDDVEGCEHEWGETIPGSSRGGSGPGGKNTSEMGYARAEPRGGFCIRCNAWRGELGSEPTPKLFVAHLVDVLAEVWRVLRDDGTLWLNMGDSYATGAGSAKSPGGGTRGERWAGAACQPNRMPIPGLKPKDLCGIPWQVAFALRDWGWYLRSDIIWAKRSPMPESVADRPTKAHEFVFLLAKREQYFYDRVAVLEKATGTAHPRGRNLRSPKEKANTADGNGHSGWNESTMDLVEYRNLRSVWSLSNAPYKGAHFATFPPKLVIPCIKAGTSEHGVCPECGAPWRRLVTRKRVATRSGQNSKVNAMVLHPDSPYQVQNGTICGNRDPQRHTSRVETTGWAPTCKCGHAGTIPAVVLDPFLGSGTTAAVAEYLGRYATGCELNPEYAELARQRIEAGYTPPKVKSKRARKAAARQRELFARS